MRLQEESRLISRIVSLRSVWSALRFGVALAVSACGGANFYSDVDAVAYAAAGASEASPNDGNAETASAKTDVAEDPGPRIEVLARSSLRRFDRDPQRLIGVGTATDADMRPANHGGFSDGAPASHFPLPVAS